MGSFSKNNDFPEQKKAFRKRNYYYKTFKSAYKRFLKEVKEIEKPANIAKATKENPFHLFDNFYTYNNKVFEIYLDKEKEILKAEPLTFRKVSGYFADKNFVFQEVKEWKNDKAIKKYFAIVKGIDGASFNYIKEKWDTIYWKDKNKIYTTGLIPLINVDYNSFEYLDYIFGKDKNKVYCYDKIIDINPSNFQIKEGFIFDDNNVYHFENKLNLDGKSFKIIKSRLKEKGSFITIYTVEDKTGVYEYERGKKLNKI